MVVWWCGGVVWQCGNSGVVALCYRGGCIFLTAQCGTELATALVVRPQPYTPPINPKP